MLVRESISFERYKDPKTALFGIFRRGQILWKPYTSSISVFYLVLDGKEYNNKITCTELGHLFFNQVDNVFFASNKEYEIQGVYKEKLQLASKEDIKIIKKSYKEDERNFKNLKKYLNVWGNSPEDKKEILKLLTESISFERYRDPKTTLFGLRPGALIIYLPAFDTRTEVYMLIEELEDNGFGDKNVTECLQIGYLLNDKFTFHEHLSMVQFFPEVERRKLTPDELKIVQEGFDSNPKKKVIMLKKIKKYAGILPYEIS